LIQAADIYSKDEINVELNDKQILEETTNKRNERVIVFSAKAAGSYQYLEGSQTIGPVEISERVICESKKNSHPTNRYPSPRTVKKCFGF
jgi:hypothetical protein